MLKLVLNNELILIRIQLYEFHKNPVPEQDADKKRFCCQTDGIWDLPEAVPRGTFHERNYLVNDSDFRCMCIMKSER